MWSLIKKYPTLMLFGILQIFFTAPGQTFLIALFISPMFTDIGSSHTIFASIYSIATLIAALFLPLAGKLIDNYPIPKILIGSVVMMTIGCLIIANAHNLAILGTGFFIVRLFGQGVFGLTASTIITKMFCKNRGKALSIITLGFPLSDALYPLFAIWLLTAVGWRSSYVYFAWTFPLIMLPIQLWLLSKINYDTTATLPEEQPTQKTNEQKLNPTQHFTLKQTTADSTFYLILLASCIPPIIVSGLFFHQTTIFELHSWPLPLIATCFMVYAWVKGITSFISGPIVDKIGPLFPLLSIIISIAAATYLSSGGGNQYNALVYYGLLGGALGTTTASLNVIWANLYGTKHIGSIKGFIAIFRNGCTAFGPLPIALALDYGFNLSQVLWLTAIGILLLTTLPLLAYFKAPHLNRIHH